MGTGHKVFVREATGLVREIGAVETIAFNSGAWMPFFGIMYTLVFTLYAVPAVDIVLAWSVGAILGLITNVSYGMVMSVFPRSGAAYVAGSRLVHPAWGFMMEGSQWFLQTACGAMTVMMLVLSGISPSVAVAGAILNDPGLTAFSTMLMNPMVVLLISTVVVVVVALVSILGVRVVMRYFLVPAWIIEIVGMVVIAGILAGQSGQGFISAFNNFVIGEGGPSGAYSTIISAAKEAGMPATTGASAWQFVLAVGLSWSAVVGANWAHPIAGEVRRGSLPRTWMIINLVSAGFTSLLVILTSGLLLGVAGKDFLAAFNYLSIAKPEALPIPSFGGAFVALFIGIISPNLFTIALIVITAVATVVAILPQFVMITTRPLFAFAFDGLLPRAIADVSDRFHTPVKAISIWAVVTEVFLVGLAVPGPFADAYWVLWAAVLGGATIPLGMLTVYGVILPFKKKYWETSPLKYHKGTLLITSIIGMIFLEFLAVPAYLLGPGMGSSVSAVQVTILIFAAALAYFWIARAYRKRQGIDIDLAFKELPPE